VFTLQVPKPLPIFVCSSSSKDINSRTHLRVII